MELFGFEIKRRQEKELPSVVAPNPAQDGSTVVSTSVGINAGGYFGQVMDLEGVIKNENDLLRRYRQIAQYGDCDTAIENIVNEAIVSVEKDQSVEIVLDDVKVSENIKNKIRDEFQDMLRLLKFEERGHEIFKQWYVDGRIYFHVVLDPKKPKDGILEIRQIDPRKIRRIKKIERKKNEKGLEVVKAQEEYYLYNDKGISENNVTGVKMSLDSIIDVPSGNVDANTGMVLSYLHKAIKPVNQLKMIEDALVIYRISRAPERRIFYVDVGNLPKLKAEQYVTDIMNKFRNKVVYDATTGEVRDDRRHLSMMEDFWMPRREGGKGTEITTLPGGQNLGEIQDIEYFQTKLYQSLNVPISRLQQQQGFSIGRSTEITRDEVMFNKFIIRLRKKFAKLFAQALRVQLVAKGVINAEEWDDIDNVMRFDFIEDNHFAELKDQEIMQTRIQMLQSIEPYIGRFYSEEWVRKNILQMPDDMIKDIAKQIGSEGDQQEEPQQQDDQNNEQDNEQEQEQ